MNDLPAPPIPASVDLAGYGFMPLYGHRLFGSDFNARCTDAEWRAGVTLWWASWNQVPAASLPDDDAALCRLAQLGRDVKGWRKLRDNALRGFVKCSDGRLYHPVLAKLAIEAWDRRVSDRERKKRWRERLNLSSDGPVDSDGDGDGRGGDADRDGDVRAEAKRSEATGTGRLRGREKNSNGAAAGSDGSNARGPAAAAAPGIAIQGLDLETVRTAYHRGDALAVLNAFGCDLSGDRITEWGRDADGLKLATVVVILAWRRSAGEPVRQPSGFRAARKAWRNLSADERLRLATSAAGPFGLPAPKAAVPGDPQAMIDGSEAAS